MEARLKCLIDCFGNRSCLIIAVADDRYAGLRTGMPEFIYQFKVWTDPHCKKYRISFQFLKFTALYFLSNDTIIFDFLQSKSVKDFKLDLIPGSSIISMTVTFLPCFP